MATTELTSVPVGEDATKEGARTRSTEGELTGLLSDPTKLGEADQAVQEFFSKNGRSNGNCAAQSLINPTAFTVNNTLDMLMTLSVGASLLVLLCYFYSCAGGSEFRGLLNTADRCEATGLYVWISLYASAAFELTMAVLHIYGGDVTFGDAKPMMFGPRRRMGVLYFICGGALATGSGYIAYATNGPFGRTELILGLYLYVIGSVASLLVDTLMRWWESREVRIMLRALMTAHRVSYMQMVVLKQVAEQRAADAVAKKQQPWN